MGLFEMFQRREQKSTITNTDNSQRELRDILLGNDNQGGVEVTVNNVMQIPAVNSCVNLVSSLVASLPVKMYQFKEDEIYPITKDRRLYLLNYESEATMSAFTMRQSLVRDFILSGNGFVYINRSKNKVESLHYVDRLQISFLSNQNPIFKDIKIMVGGFGTYEVYDFINLVQNSKDGVQGKGMVANNSELLSTMLTAMRREKSISYTGGVNRGIIKSQSKLSQETMIALKDAWKELYNGSNNALVLNSGMEFVPVSSTSKDLELYNNKSKNHEAVAELMGIPLSILDGTASDEVFNNFVKTTIQPIITQLALALNNSLLLENEKGKKFFVIDTDELLKADIEKRMKAYEVALKNSVYTLDEVRAKENLRTIPNIGGLVRMSQGEVLYNPETNSIFNTNSSTTTILDDRIESVQDESPMEVLDEVAV